MTDNPANRRAYVRISVKIPGKVHLKSDAKKVFDAEILDISVGGAFVHCTAPIMIGEEVLVEIQFSSVETVEAKVIDYEEWLKKQLPGTEPEPSVIRWARGTSNHGFGIEFVSLAPDKRAFLDRLIEYYERLQRAGVSFIDPRQIINPK